MLDEFCPVEPKPITPITPTAPEASTKPIPEDEFEKQLEAEMVELFGDLKTMPEMATGLENMLEQMGVTMAKGQESKSQKFPLEAEKINTKSGSKLASTGVEENFQDAINKTMERMAASGDQATAAAASEDVDSMVTEFLKAMQASDLTGEGNVEEDFSKALLGMMEQLTSKEILYEPMKELDNKFPAWIEEHGAEVDKADLEQYKLQQTCVREIVERFQSDKYNDDSATDKEYIVERMQKVCNPHSYDDQCLSFIDASRRLPSRCSRGGPSSSAGSARSIRRGMSHTVIIKSFIQSSKSLLFL